MKACFIGLGSIGTRHCVNLANICARREIPLELHAVRRTAARLRPELDKLEIRMLGEYEEMDDDYDAIFITNPSSMHYETLMRVSGKARGLFIEKPVFGQVNEDISALQLRPDTVAYVAAPLRYTGVLQKAREIVDTNRVYSARAISSSYLPDWRPGVDYRQTYSAHRNMGGGVAIDLIHEWDYLTAFFGFPEQVYSLIGRYSHLEIDSDDLALYIARYSDKLVEIHLDYFGRQTIRRLELFTEGGTFLFDIAGSCVTCPNGDTVAFDEDANVKYVREMSHFLSLIEQGQAANDNTIEHAARVLKLTQGETA